VARGGCVLHGDAPPHGDGTGGLAADAGFEGTAVRLELPPNLPQPGVVQSKEGGYGHQREKNNMRVRRRGWNGVDWVQKGETHVH
jgi:hypothetical protein